ncbi:YoaK family protein [Jatrophihabitans fulvus]
MDRSSPVSSPVSSETATVAHRPGPIGAVLRDRLVVVLAVCSGATDAIGFLALGSAFTSVMTGNMVLFGMSASDGDLEGVLLTAVAIASFGLGAALGARVAGNPDPGDPVWPHAVTRALTVEFGLFAAFAIVWWSLAADPPEGAYLPLLAVNALALGLQSSAIQRFGVSGLSTTYLTGTFTTVMIRLVSGKGVRAVGHSVTILLGLIAGAAAGAALVRWAAPVVPAIQLVPVGLVLAVVTLRRRAADAGSAGTRSSTGS